MIECSSVNIQRSAIPYLERLLWHRQLPKLVAEAVVVAEASVVEASVEAVVVLGNHKYL
jgi:hypothetical protein